MGGGPNSLPKEPETLDAETKLKIAISKLDEVGTTFRGGAIRDKIKELTSKFAIVSKSNISAKIQKLEEEFNNYNPTDIDDWFKKSDEIASKIKALKNLQEEINDFLIFNINTTIFCINYFEDPTILDTSVINKEYAQQRKWGEKYISILNKGKATGIWNGKLSIPFNDIYSVISQSFLIMTVGEQS